MKRVLLAIVLVAGFSAIGSAQQYTYYFPHIAVGTFPGGSWQTTIFITNSSAPGTLASGAITFTQSDGSAYNVQFVDGDGNPVAGGSTIPFQLNAGETRKFVSVATGPLATGYATVTSNAAVLGNAMFTQLDGNGNTVGEAGVPAAIPLGRQAIFVDTLNGYHTGVAIANPNTASLEVHFELLDNSGNMINSQVRTLPPLQHISLFVDELFPGTPPMTGRLQFYCTNPMASVALRFTPGFNLFTTMPPVAIAGLIHSIDAPAMTRREWWVLA